ncbi:MAG TPA: hypothetical protein ENG98_02075 [Actinobacteria bacterium]|nr:hypothetical protein [Actinomycetota bacterium]
MVVIAVLLAGACSLGGGTEDARWWIDRGAEIDSTTTSFEVRVAYRSCAKSQMKPEAIEDYSVAYGEDTVTVSISVRLPDGPRPRECPPPIGGEPIIVILLEEPLGDRTLMVGSESQPPVKATVYNF